MTYQQISKTSSAKSKTPTTSESALKPLAPIAKQTTSTPTSYKHQEQTQGLLHRKTNLLANLGSMAEPKAKQTIGQPGDKYKQEADAIASEDSEDEKFYDAADAIASEDSEDEKFYDAKESLNHIRNSDAINTVLDEPEASSSYQSKRREESQPSNQEGKADKKFKQRNEEGIVKSDTALSELNKVPESISPQVPQQEQSQPPHSQQNLLDRETQPDVITQEPHSQQNLLDRETQPDVITQEPHSQQQSQQQQSQQNLLNRETQPNIITQSPHLQQQSPTTRFQKIKKSIAKPLDATKEVRKVLAEGIKQHETYSDQTKILGQDSPKSDIDQVLGQNLPANEKNPMTVLKPLPADVPQKFGNDAAVIGMTRDIAKATGGLLRVSDNLKKFKDAAFVNKDKPIHERIGDASGSLGEIVSTVTYTGIVLSQAVRGIEHHTKKQPGQKTTFASGAIAAVKLGGKLGGKTIPSIQQGGLIGGTSLPFDIGKATASTLTSIPKLIATVDKAYKAYPLENFGGYEYLVSGLRNVTDLTKSVAGAIKDVAGLVNNLNLTGAGAEGTQIVAGGAVAPAAGAVLGGIEVIEGTDKFRKAYNQYRNPGEIPENKTLNQFKKEQKDKMIRAGIDTTLGAVALGAGVVGFNGGPRELLAATAMGASVGGFQIGEWGIRKLKQKVQHNSQATTFDVEQGYQPEATANILHQP